MKFIGIFWITILYFNLKTFSADVETCNFRKCGECISSTENCIWCSDEKITEDRCQPASYINVKSTKPWCKNDLIERSTYKTKVLREDDFSAGEKGAAIQLKPQNITFTGRPGQSIQIQMSYKPAQHYPLDVYYLMDNSYTMKKHVEALKEQANELYKVLTNLTNNVRLGVGSFIEKPAFPYYDINNQNKDISYVFKNHVNLTNDTSVFKLAINSISFGSNYDDPEAGLDALMQVMTCKNKLGWREKSRKFIVLCTDNTYHSAGDGKMIGIIKPNDMQCHFDGNSYTKELEHDYPSVSQINRIARDGGFQVIFAVNNYSTEYTALAKQIVGAKYAPLGESSVVDIIKNTYTEAVSYLNLDSNLPDAVQLALDPDCRKESKNHEGCGLTHTESTVNIIGTLKIKYCPEVDKQIAEISPIGLDDKLTIEINYNCKCKCEAEEGALSPKCNNAGSRQCGLCNCIAPSYGNDCQCNGTSSDLNDLKKCTPKGSDQYCSGRGQCTCGKCEECAKGFSGNFCEFDDLACPRANKILCSDHGNCRFGRCHCFKDWTGDDCSCTLKNDGCKAPQSKNVCSGNGVCKCGVCQCNKVTGKNESYSGGFCDTCDECAEERCRELEDYVYCNYNMNKKTVCDQQYNATDVQEVNIVNKKEINGPEWYTANWCKKLLDDGSHLVFKYKYNGTALILVIQKEPELPSKANIWLAIGSAIGAVLLIGLLTVVIWKILIDMHDAREYDKFSKESAAAGFDVNNPIYESPETHFTNPAYKGDT